MDYAGISIFYTNIDEVIVSWYSKYIDLYANGREGWAELFADDGVSVIYYGNHITIFHGRREYMEIPLDRRSFTVFRNLLIVIDEVRHETQQDARQYIPVSEQPETTSDERSFEENDCLRVRRSRY